MRIDADVEFGEGCILAGRVIMPGSVLGNYITFFHATAGKCKIGDFSTIETFANVTTSKMGNGVYVGTHAVLLPDIIVEDEVVVGAGAIVVHRVKEKKTVLGNPARKVVKLNE